MADRPAATDATPEPMPLLRVLRAATMVDDAGASFPAAVVDLSEHPEIADLARIHVAEGVGDTRTEVAHFVSDGRTMVMIGVRVTSPVVAAFALLFDLDTHEHLLFEAADANTLAVAPASTLTQKTPLPPVLALDIDGLALRMHL